MIMETSRFGKIEVDEHLAIRFPSGIFGFPRFTDYVLIQPSEESYFYWLHATEDPSLACEGPAEFGCTAHVLRPRCTKPISISVPRPTSNQPSANSPSW